MKKRIYLILTAIIALTFSSCEKSDNDFIEENNDAKSEVFDFKTRTEVNLTLNYGFEGYSVPFEIFTSNPFDENGIRSADTKPIFAAFTDKNSSFNGKVELPAHAKKVYLYSEAFAIPRLLELDVTNGKMEYIYQPTNVSTRGASYQGECVTIGTNKTVIDQGNKLFALYDDYSTSNNSTVKYTPSNRHVPAIYSTISNNTQISANSTLGELLNRVKNALKKTDNSRLCTDSEHTNLRIATHIMEDNEIVEVEGAHIDLTYLAASGEFHNAMGYYYYKTGSELTGDDIKALPKFMVFPRTTVNIPNQRIKARLQFFGEDYNEDGIDHFPPGYTIGWILIADLANLFGNSNKDLDTNASISTVNRKINELYKTQSVYSNKEANKNQYHGCITLSDELSEKIIIGFEDQTFNDKGDYSYEDILFYVECDPKSAIEDPDRPIIPPGGGETLVTETKSSTIAFEDIWPSGGDYDMNDVVVELDNAITINQDNKIKKIVTTVKAVHNGATLTNAFGLVFNGAVGTIKEDESNYFTKEETNQFILFDNILKDVGGTFTIVRTFGEEGIDKLTYVDTFNPFIAISYKQGEKGRKEVHLPTYPPTSWMDQSLVGTGKDLFYVDKEEGIYPFAFELFDIKNWEVVTEKSKIGSEGEYPKYNGWAESKGATNKDWYLHRN